MSEANWRVVDGRTAEDFTPMQFPTKVAAQQRIDFYRDRDRRGGRPDLSEFMPHLRTLRRRSVK